jgi:hypothetical protein
MTSECVDNLRFVATFIIALAMFNATDLLTFIQNDIGAAIAIFMSGGMLILVPMLLLTIRKEDDEYEDDDDEEITEAAKVLCQLRQVECETAKRNEQRKHAYATRSAAKTD